MPGFFEAAKNFKQVVKKYTVTLQGQTIEVTLDKKLEMNKNGIENYYLKTDGTLSMREKKNTRYRYPEIEKFMGDPYWPKERFEWKK
jgi:hypothetical protein